MRYKAPRSYGISRAHITLLYVLMGTLWVLLSYDTIHKHLTDPAIFFVLRGLYICLTALVIHFLMYRMDKSRRTSEREYRDLVTLGHEPIVVCVDGIIHESNRYAEELLSGTDTSIVGRPIRDFVHPDEPMKSYDPFGPVTEAKMHEMKFRRLDGTTLHLEVATIPAPHYGDAAMHLLFKDRSAQVRAEDALQNYANTFRAIEENISDYLCVLDECGKIMYSSPSLNSLMGNAVVIEDGHFSLTGVHPDDYQKLMDGYRSSQEQRSAFDAEVRISREDGSWASIEVRGVPILSGQVGSGGMVLVARDITDRQNAHRLMRQTERLNVVAELAAAVAHEIRNPLTIVRGFLQLHQLYGQGSSEYLGLMLAEVDKVEAIISEFLMMTQPEPFRFAPICLQDLFAQASSVVRDKAESFGVHIELRTKPNLPPIFGHQDQVKQVFVNILDRAIESMPFGGAILVKASEKSRDRVTVQFVDEGTGADDLTQLESGSRIFANKSDGTGLRLIVCQRIVESHDGEFSVYRRADGRGTVVELSLPVVGWQTSRVSPDIVSSSYQENGGEM